MAPQACRRPPCIVHRSRFVTAASPFSPGMPVTPIDTAGVTDSFRPCTTIDHLLIAGELLQQSGCLHGAHACVLEAIRYVLRKGLAGGPVPSPKNVSEVVAISRVIYASGRIDGETFKATIAASKASAPTLENIRKRADLVRQLDAVLSAWRATS